MANENGHSITVYSAGANGNASPTATISGLNTGLNGPSGITLDGSGNLYVANSLNSITVYDAAASGNASPTVTISGSNTALNFPNSVALDGSGNRYVSNQGVGGVKIYAAAATGNASPAGTITSGVSVPQCLAFLP